MKILRWILTSLLAIVLIFSAPLSYAQTIAPPSSTFQIPNSDQVVRHIKRIGVYALVLDFAVKQLVEAVDWVLEPENNRVRYTDKFKNEKIYSSSHIKLGMSEYIDSEDFDYIAHYSCQNGHSSNRVYNGQFSQTSHSVNIECIWADTGYPAGTATFYKHDKPQYIPLNIIAQQIIQNAQNGHQPSIDFLKDVADDVAKQSVSNGDDAKPDVKPINPPKNEPNEPKQCKPCITTTGRKVLPKTIGYRPLEIIPDNVMQHGVYGSHHNIFISNQAPINSPRPCYCFWAKQNYVLKPHQITPKMVPVEPFVN